jgi:hypothetical protein
MVWYAASAVLHDVAETAGSLTTMLDARPFPAAFFHGVDHPQPLTTTARGTGAADEPGGMAALLAVCVLGAQHSCRAVAQLNV